MTDHEKRISVVGEYLDRLELSREILDFYKDRSVLVTGGAGAIGGRPGRP